MLALLSACTTSPAKGAWENAQQAVSVECDAPNSDQCVLLACDEGECGLFECEDMDPEATSSVALEDSVDPVRGFRAPFRAPGNHRNWRRAGLREDAKPRMTFHFRYRHGFLPAFPRLEGRLIKHHLFPQEARLATWFRANGINIHEWTMLVPEQVHLRVHRGARGGLWNEAWRQYYEANSARPVSREELLSKAFELALRYDLAGPIHSYYSPVPPPGPQLLAP
ncbi:TIGR02269 family lipoprotein [Stigmatella aurantiaca]|nr:TIGR02269 family lipoprotein [Stigmatella aurantiaca]